MQDTVVADDAGLLGLRTAYLEAVGAGAETFTAAFREGVLGLDSDHPSGDLALAPPGAREPPPIDVVLRSDGLTVLANLPLRIAARSVTIEGLALVGALRPALGISATRSISLTRLVVLGAQGDPRQRAVVDLTAWGPDVALAVESSTLARSTAPDALLGCYVASNAWFGTVRLDGTTLAGDRSDAVVAIAAAASLEWSDSRLGLGSARVLLRLDWPAKRGTMTGCTLSAPAGRLLEIRSPAPVPVDPVRLAGGTRTSTAPPPAFEPDGTLVEATQPDLDEEIVAAVARVAAHVGAVDERLSRLAGSDPA